MAFNKKERMPEAVFTGLAYFAQVHSPSNKFNQLKYVLQLKLEGEELAKAEKLNLNIKKASKWVDGPHIEVKRNVKGPQTKAPEVMDSLNNPLPKTVLIGNQSKVKVKVGLYDNTKGKMAAYMDKVKVLNLVEYVPEHSDDFMAVEEDGFASVLPTIEQDEKAPFVAAKDDGKGKKPKNDLDDEIPF